MKREDILKKIKAAARRDQKLRKDPRYRRTMGFLVAKGFLRANQKIQLFPNIRLSVDDAIWAGQKVEPRILEVLPAAVLRLAKHFDLDPVKNVEMANVLEDLRLGNDFGRDFLGIPFARLKVWTELPLLDRRTKVMTEKKQLKTFRLKPATIAGLKQLARQDHCSESEVIEKLVANT